MSADTTQPAKKRARLDEPGDGADSAERPAASLGERSERKDPDFWFDDGTVTLIARDVQFRVYKGILVEHSPVFADMFSFPQPVADRKTNDGVPVVHLTDSPEDVRHIMRAFYPRKGSKFVHKDDDQFSFAMISAYARLGHKYQIEDLVAQVVDFITAFFTNDYDAWYHRGMLRPQGWTTAQVIGVVNIARLLNCDTVLPTALMVCAILPAKDLLAGVQHEDGTMERLDHEDLVRCVNGKEVLAQTTSAMLLRTFAPYDGPPPRYCPAPAVCSAGTRMVLHSYEQDPGLFAGTHPFYHWTLFYSPEELEYMGVYGNICVTCEQELEDSFLQEQRIAWRRLPKLMSVTVKNW